MAAKNIDSEWEPEHISNLDDEVIDEDEETVDHLKKRKKKEIEAIEEMLEK